MSNRLWREAMRRTTRPPQPEFKATYMGKSVTPVIHFKYRNNCAQRNKWGHHFLSIKKYSCLTPNGTDLSTMFG